MGFHRVCNSTLRRYHAPYFLHIHVICGGSQMDCYSLRIENSNGVRLPYVYQLIFTNT